MFAMVFALSAAFVGKRQPTVPNHLEIRVKERHGRQQLLLSAHHSYAEIDAIAAKYGMRRDDSRRTLAQIKQLNRFGSGGPVLEAKFPTGESVRLLGLSSVDPAHFRSWAADGAPLPRLLPFGPTDAIPETHGFHVETHLGARQPIWDDGNFLRQAVLDVSGVSYVSYAGFQVTHLDGTQAPEIEANGMPHVNTHLSGRLAANLPVNEIVVEGAFRAEARVANLAIQIVGSQHTYEKLQAMEGVVDSKSLQRWLLLPGSDFDSKSSVEKRLASKDTLVYADYSRAPGPEYTPSELNLVAVVVSGKRVKAIPLGDMRVYSMGRAPGNDLKYLKGNLFRGRSIGWILKGVQPKEVRSLLVTRNPMLYVTFHNVQLHPRP